MCVCGDCSAAKMVFVHWMCELIFDSMQFGV